MHRYLLTCALALPLPAAAAETIGQITATVNGTEMSWFVTAEGDESQSGAMTMPGGLADVSLWGNPTEGALAELKGALLLDFAAMAAGGPTALDPSLQYLEDGYTAAWVALDEETVQVSLTTFETGGDSVQLEGTFQAQAAFTDDMATMTTDPARHVEIVGRFEASLPMR